MSKEEDPFEAARRRDEETTAKLAFMRRPVWRGILNGIALAGLILVFRAYGILQPEQEVTQDDVAEAAVAGAFFAVIMYFWTIWTNKRRDAKVSAAEVARRAVEGQPDRDDQANDGKR